MMTLAEMRALLTRYLRDGKQYKWSPAELDALLTEAWHTVLDIVLEHPQGQSWLWRPQAPQVLAAQQESYPLPGDLLRVRGVQYRRGTERRATLTCGPAGTVVLATWQAVTAGSFALLADDRLTRVSGINLTGAASLVVVAERLQAAWRAATGGTPAVTWTGERFVFAAYGQIAPLTGAGSGTALEGANLLNGAAGTVSYAADAGAWLNLEEASAEGQPLLPGRSLLSATGTAGLPGYTWQLAPGAGYLRLLPRPTSADGLFRVWYAAAPPFPTAATERLRELPEGVDQVLVYLAAALALNEEVEKQLPLGHFGRLAAWRLETWLGGRVARHRPRLYIERVD